MMVALDGKIPCNYEIFQIEARLREDRGTVFVVQVDHVKLCLEFVAGHVL
jgi:hypothetical protein